MTAPPKPDPADREPPDGGSPSPLGPGTTVNARYLIERELGRGGIGVVYLARDLRLHDMPVVIKFLLDDSTQNAWLSRKFLQEAEALTRIHHPGVVRVIDRDRTADGRPFFVMEFVKGVSLRSVIRPSGARSGVRGRDRARRRPGAERGAPGGRAPSRLEAREHHAGDAEQRRATRQTHRLRHRQGPGLPRECEHRARDIGRLAPLHGAGAAPRHTRIGRQRHLCVRRRRLRAADRSLSVQPGRPESDRGDPTAHDAAAKRARRPAAAAAAQRVCGGAGDRAARAGVRPGGASGGCQAVRRRPGARAAWRRRADPGGRDASGERRASGDDERVCAVAIAWRSHPACAGRGAAVARRATSCPAAAGAATRLGRRRRRDGRARGRPGSGLSGDVTKFAGRTTHVREGGDSRTESGRGGGENPDLRGDASTRSEAIPGREGGEE